MSDVIGAGRLRDRSRRLWGRCRQLLGRTRRLLGRARRRFRLWRRGRPFWGGLLFLLAGVQLWLSTNLNPLHFEISFGPTGFLVIMLPLVLLLCGLLVWITPQHRVFYGVIGIVTALYSLLGLNLGGWFIGMLLGILGGSLALAWTPVAPAPAVPRQGAAADEPTGPLTDATPDQHQVAPVRAPKPPPRTFAVLAVPLLLAGALALPAPAAAPEPTPCPPELVEATEEERRSLLGRMYDWWTGLWDGSRWRSDEPTAAPTELPCPPPSNGPEPSPSPQPEPTPSPAPGPAPTPGETPTPDPSDGPAAGPSPTASPADSPSPAPSPTPPPELPVPAGHPLVAAEPALLSADRLDLRSFRFEGIAELPTTEGTVRALKFTFSRATNHNFRMVTNRSTTPQTTVADPLVLAGDVEFYAASFTGRALGILPLTLHPDDDDLLLRLLELINLPLPLFFTDVEQELVFTHGGQLTAAGLSQQ